MSAFLGSKLAFSEYVNDFPFCNLKSCPRFQWTFDFNDSHFRYYTALTGSFTVEYYIQII